MAMGNSARRLTIAGEDRGLQFLDLGDALALPRFAGDRAIAKLSRSQGQALMCHARDNRMAT